MSKVEKIKAEIDMLQSSTLDENSNFKSQYDQGIFDGLSLLENFIDTLEVKDVDFEKEFFDWYHKNTDYNASILYERYGVISKKLAKHFFELGLKAQKGENAKEERYVVGVTGKYTTTTK